jgi:cation diffusion facilitator family transporter
MGIWPRMGRETAAEGSAETRKTVLAAGAANVVIAVTKLFAGLIAGSSAMLAEAAHSLADTLNQGFLLASLGRSTRPADHRHPFGYGKERYFWSLIAAVGIFVAGACYSIFEGINEIVSPGEHGDATVAFIVLGIAFVAEGLSLVRATYQVRKEAAERDRDMLEHVQRTPDTTLKAAVLEDSTAVVGLALATAGLTLREVTGSSVWDGVASILIGVLLVLVAFTLGRNSKNMLIGQSVDKETQRTIRGEIESTRGVDRVLELLTMHLGPDDLLVAAKVAFTDDISADEAEDIADGLDLRLRERCPIVRHVFLDPTQHKPATRQVAARDHAVTG